MKQKREEEDESEPLEGTTEYFEKEFLAKNQGEAAKEGKKEKKEVKAEKREVKTEKKSAMGRDVSLKELVNRCSSIPLRLTAEERVLLHILEGFSSFFLLKSLSLSLFFLLITIPKDHWMSVNIQIMSMWHQTHLDGDQFLTLVFQRKRGR